MTDLPQTQTQQAQPGVKQKKKRIIDPLNKPGPQSLIDRLYKTPEQLESKIAEYFNGGAYCRKVVTQLGQEVSIPCPTITDLVLFLGFNNRKAVYDYENHPIFGSSIKRARLMIEREYEMLLRTQSCTGAIFALKNFGWIDKQEHEHTGTVTLINQIPEPQIVRDSIISRN